MLDKLYIRFGDIPENEKSSQFRGSGDDIEKCRTLDGVSAYECVIRGGLPKLIIPTPITERVLDTLWGLIKYSGRPIYLVSGDIIGYGPDNEPLIKNINIIKNITSFL